MEDQAVEDDGYSDDDLDALPDYAFYELQENAVRSTQQPSTRAQLPALRQLPRPDPPRLGGSFGRLSVGKPPANANDLYNYQPPSSDYGDFNDEMLDGEIFDAAEEPNLAAKHDASVVDKGPGDSTLREQWRQQRYGAPLAEPRIPEPHAREQVVAREPIRNVAIPQPNYNGIQGTNSVRPRNGDTSIQPLSHGAADVEDIQAQIQNVRLNFEAMYRVPIS